MPDAAIGDSAVKIIPSADRIQCRDAIERQSPRIKASPGAEERPATAHSRPWDEAVANC